MIYFTSDPHYWHANIIRYCNRPFATVDEMNGAMIKNWNDVVKPEDTVYCLGDFSLAFRPVEAYSALLNGTKYLVPGNHDFCHSYHKKSRNAENRKKWIEKYEAYGWKVLPEQTTLEIPGVATVNMCHHPYRLVNAAGETYDDKYEKWRPKDDGRWLLCGHIHEKWKIVDRMINVGVDQWGFKPVSIDEISKIICTKDGEIKPVDSSGWCPDHAICMEEWIERRALQYLENFQDADTVYMSEDVYIQFLKTEEQKMRYNPGQHSNVGLQILAVQTSAGLLTVKPVPLMSNFCHVGTSTTYDDLVRIQVDQMFEDIFLKDCERE